VSVNDYTTVHIGLDDVDTQFSGCTTHVTYRILKNILNKYSKVTLLDFPNLIRLNPTIPFKTRGNAALALRLKVPTELLGSLKKDVVDEVLKYVSTRVNEDLTSYGVDPGLAFVYGEVSEPLRKLYLKALTDYVHMDYLVNVINELNGRVETPLGLKRGLVGALAAVGAVNLPDCTYELIVYRHPNNYLKERCVDVESIKAMDEEFKHVTFLNYDYSKDKPLITPSGSNPVLLGIRGEDPKALLKAFKSLKICEEIEGWAVFKTNQGTNAHHVRRSLDDVRPYQTGCFEGVVLGRPSTLRGGDVMIKIVDGVSTLNAVAFKETGLNKVLQALMDGDRVEVCGGVKFWTGFGPVLHVDKVSVLDVVRVKYLNPKCPKCGHRMKSLGRGKGWRCPKCGFKASNLARDEVTLERSVSLGVYVPVDRAVKHLIMPEVRYGRWRACVDLPMEVTEFIR